MLLRSRQAHAYSWRTPHTVKDNPRLHVCIETEGDWRWSEPFEIDTVGVFSRTIHHRLHSATLFIEVKQLSGMQKQVCTQLWYSTRYQNEKHSGRRLMPCPHRCSKVCHRQTHRSIRVHTTFLMRFRLPTLKRSKTTELKSISVGRLTRCVMDDVQMEN